MGQGLEQALPRVAVVTDIAFWRGGRGDAARIAALVRFLNEHTDLRILFLSPPGPHGGAAAREIVAIMAAWDIHLVLADGRNAEQSRRAFDRFLGSQRLDACIFEFLRLAPLRARLPPGVRAVLDTHDIIAHRNASFRAFGAAPIRDLSPEEELATYALFDQVMLIQQHDYRAMAPQLRCGAALLAPHPVTLHRHPPREGPPRVGFLASSYPPNRDGLQWFLREVWPQLTGCGLSLHVFGTVCRALTQVDDATVHARGTVEDVATAYGEMDMVINPVRFGAGLKIKSVEALGHGLPLVTSRHGASGIEEGADHAFLMADSAADFAGHLRTLTTSPEVRRRVGGAALAFAHERLSPAACFSDLLAVLQTPKPIARRAP